MNADDIQVPDTAGAVAAYLNPQPAPARAAQSAMSIAVDANPDLDAELRRAAARTGVPIEAAREYPEDVKRQAALAGHDFDGMAKQFPTTTRFLSDPENARLSHDDVANLSSTESAIMPIYGPRPTFMSYTGGLLKSFEIGADQARQGIRMQMADLYDEIGLFSPESNAAMRSDAQGKRAFRELEGKLTRPDFNSRTASGVYSGLSSTLRQAPGLAASIATRSTAPMLATMGVQTEAEAYGKYRSRGATAGEALVGAVGEAAVEVGTEKMPMGFLVKNMGKVGAGKFITGVLAREVPSEQLATLVQDALDTAIANPNKTWGEYAAERGDAAYQTLVATLTQTAVMGGMNSGIRLVQQRGQQAEHAGKVGEALAQFNDLAAASKVRERDVSTAQAFFQSLMQDGRDKVWITPQALAESGMLEQVAQALPAVAAQLEQSANTGADISIPIADLMANLAGPEIAQSIIPHLAEEPGGFTQTTANEYMQSGAAQELAEEVRRTLDGNQASDTINASRDKVAAGVLEQLNTTGRFSPSVNEAYASMVGNFYAVQSARLGITPEEMAKKYQLQVKAERMPGARTLEQPGTIKGLVSEIEAQHQGLKLDVMESGNTWNLSRIVLPKEQRGQGTGTKIMQQLIEQADAAGKTMILTPGADFGGSVPRLKKFYKGLGFVENSGRNKDFKISESMYRPPANQSKKVRLEMGSVSGRWDKETRDRWELPWGKAKRLASEGKLTAEDAVAIKEISNGKESEAVDSLAKLVKEIKKRPAPNVLNQDPPKVPSGWGGEGLNERTDVPPVFGSGTNTRGAISMGKDITAQPSIITLLAGADLSTFLHESGHFFLEVMNDMASRADAPAEIAADMNATLAWFGVPDLATWNAMDLEAKRPHHETFARGFESYLFEGRAPTAELSGVFSRFRSWLVNVYQSLTALNVQLTDEVRDVFDRMLASSEAIEQAEREAGFAGMFGEKPDFMTDEEWTAYRALNYQASQDAVHELETRSLADMKWLGNAKAKVLRDLQREANEKRSAIKVEVMKEVFAQPVYQAWQFLTLRGSDSTRAWPTPEFKLDAKHVDTRVDNLYTAIAKYGGLNRDEVKTKWGVDHRDMPDSGVFGKPVLRKSGGLSIERMAEKLVEDHYLDEHDLAEFEDKFDRQRGGQDQFSWEYQYSNGERAPVEPLGDSNYHGKLNTPMLRHMYGEQSDTVQHLIAQRVTSTDGGLDPDDVAEMLGGFDSGRAMVDALAQSEKPSKLINSMVDQRMLERYGDLKDEAVIQRAIDEALHSRAHTRFLVTELNALKKASGAPAILAKAAQAYADKIVRRTAIRDLRPDQYTAAARRAARAADKAFKAGDVQEAAAQKQIQLVNTYAAKAAMDAREEVAKTMTRFTRIANGNNETAAKTRDMDMVQATRAILAEFGVGSRGKKATEYLTAVEAYDPAMAAVLRDRIDAATENAMPIKDMTIEQLGALKDDIESLWFLAKRSRQMEVDGDLLDRQDIQDQLRDRLIEIGVPEVAPGEGRAITPGEVALSKLQGIMASLRRIESWAGAKDGQEMGPFRKFIWNTIKDPTDAYRVDKAKYLRKYRELLSPIAPTLAKVKIAAPELGYTFGFDQGGMGKAELLHAILHTGNKGNKRKLLLAPRTKTGASWGALLESGEVDTGRWDSFINRMITEGVLTKADFDFAQGVWDLMEEMKPAAQKAHRDVFGRYFDEVTADPFKTPWGEYAGGYVPAIADNRIVSDAKTRGILEEQNSMLSNAMPSTSKGFTKSRVEYNKPLLLDLRLLSQHIDKVLLFTHLEQPIRDVRRILASATVSRPLNRIDPAAYDELLTPWLHRTGLQQVETPVSGAGGKAFMRFASVMRQRAGMAAMFANVSNTLQQLTGFSMAMLKVKPSHLMGAAAQFMHAPRDMAAAVAETSPYMSNRMENEVSAMTGAINDILLNPSLFEQGQAWALKHSYFLQSAFDNVMGPIIWTGAYNQALETAPAGLSDDALKLYARRLADSAVRETQGSTLPEDVARFETGNAFMRLFTQFAGYFNMQANLLGTEFSKIAHDEIGVGKKFGRGFYVTMFGFLAPAWVATAIAIAFRGGPDDEDKDGSYLDDWLLQTFGWGTVRSATAMVPVVGQTANAVANKFNKKPYDDRISTGPAISMLESAAGAPGGLADLATGKGNSTKVIRDVATLTTLMTGLPVTAMARPASYAADVGSGRAAPAGPVDVARGAITGVASPASKGR